MSYQYLHPDDFDRKALSRTSLVKVGPGFWHMQSEGEGVWICDWQGLALAPNPDIFVEEELSDEVEALLGQCRAALRGR